MQQWVGTKRVPSLPGIVFLQPLELSLISWPNHSVSALTLSWVGSATFCLDLMALWLEKLPSTLTELTLLSLTKLSPMNSNTVCVVSSHSVGWSQEQSLTIGVAVDVRCTWPEFVSESEAFTFLIVWQSSLPHSLNFLSLTLTYSFTL